jgi:glycosyltransferase involved in cell wall biosynthesis
MRVAVVDPSLFTLPYDAGLVRGLQANGAEVSFHGRAVKPQDGDAGGIVIQHDFYRVAGWFGMLPKPLRLLVKGVDHGFSLLRLLRKLRRSPPDIIHFQWLPLPFLDAALLGRFRAIAPVLLTVHDTNPFNGDPTARLQRLGVMRALAKCDRLIVHTRQAVARLTGLGLEPQKIIVVPHGAFVAAPRAGTPESPTDVVNFVLFGKIKPYKGADVLIEAFRLLPDGIRGRARIRIIGQSYMKLEPLRQQASAAGLGDLVSIEDRFVGDDEISSLFGPNTVAVFPYREIEASGVLSHAVAHGRPVIASKIGLFAEMLADGIHGVLVPSEDTAALSAAMRRMITDPDFVLSCEAAVGTLSKAVPDWNEVGAVTMQLYRDCILERGRSAALEHPQVLEGMAS